MPSTLLGLRRRPLPNRVGVLTRRMTEAAARAKFLSPSVLRWNEKRSPGAVAVPSGCSIGAVAVHETAHRSTSAPVRPLSPQFIGAVAVRLYNHSLCTRGRRRGAARSHQRAQRRDRRSRCRYGYILHHAGAFGRVMRGFVLML